ncbi:MAG: hypothetical protein ALECFALPRED_004806 [Alectoria fallacina]|uniref:Major facilitator superfamily (MFS) profile domain-containing protein n=1 Tax=Alectoria fallacina TaxID=1903189 RepID=A0A8H3EF25_9LECA|nr:MAG: hypothetical protein ALECFALPRED_004806 [Alectoria fallacina]
MGSTNTSERELVLFNEIEKTNFDATRAQYGHAKKEPAGTLEASSNKIPDGGFFAWLQVAGAYCIFFNTWGVVNSYGVYQQYYSSSRLQSHSDSQIAWIGSMQGFLLLLVSVVTGPLYDAGYLRTLVYGGTFLTILGMMMTSICQTYGELLLAQGIVVGVGDGLLFLPSIVIVSQYFDKKRALATGIASMGSSIGGVIYPIVFRQLQPTVGFPWATRVVAFIMLATSIITVPFIKQRVPSTSLRKVYDASSFRDPPYLFFCLGIFFGFMGIYIAFFYVELYATQVCGMSARLATYVLAVVNTGSFFGRLFPNWLADQIGPLNVQIPFALIASLLAFCWIAIRNTPGLLIFCALYGFFSGTFVSLPGPIVYGLSSDMSTVGTRLGMSMGFAGVGLLVGNPIAGAILRGGGGWVGLQAWAGTLIAVSAGCMMAARWAKFGGGLRTVA